jgi:hypothetical protein
MEGREVESDAVVNKEDGAFIFQPNAPAAEFILPEREAFSWSKQERRQTSSGIAYKRSVEPYQLGRQ